MAGIPGVNVAGMVVPFDDQDIYPTHGDQYGKGGFRPVASLIERDAIAALRRREGMWVKVLSNGGVYELIGGIENQHWRPVVLGGGGANQPPLVVQLIAGDWAGADAYVADEAGTVTWKVQVDDPSQKRRVVLFVSSAHDGIGGDDPQEVQWTVFGKLRFGTLSVEIEVALDDGADGKMVSLKVRSEADGQAIIWRIQGLG